MKKKLPKIQSSISNKSFKEREDYLCEEEIYSVSNYDKIRKRHSSFINERKMNWLTPIYQKDTNRFAEAFDDIMKHTSNDWISARMIVHCSIDTFSLGGQSLFEWADDRMIDYMMTSEQLNR
jgi:hypothetical protein